MERLTYEDVLFLTRAVAALRDNAAEAEDEYYNKFTTEDIETSLAENGFIARAIKELQNVQDKAEQMQYKLAVLSDEVLRGNS